MMRTTIDLPDDVHRAASLLARDRHQTLSRTVAELVLRALTLDEATTSVETDEQTGLPVLRVGRPITADDVAAIQDEE